MSESAAGKRYRTVNRAVLAVILFGLALPVFGPHIARLFPRLYPQCASLALFRRPCPLCGLTRGLALLIRGDLAGACRSNPLSLPVLALLVVELAWRGAASFARFPSHRLHGIVGADRRIHLVGAAAYLLYALVFAFA